MSRVNNLERELNQMARQRQQREERLLGKLRTTPATATPAAAAATVAAAVAVGGHDKEKRPARASTANGGGGGGGAALPSGASPSSSPCSSSLASSNTQSSADDDNDDNDDDSSNDEEELNFSSPSTTGSRFDLLMEGGGHGLRSEVRRAGTAQQKQQKPKSHAAAAATPSGSPKSGADAASPASPLSLGLSHPSATPISIPTPAPYRRLQVQPFSHVLVCDFEATCEGGSVHYPHEIIEFPVVAIDTATLQVVAEFHSYVRPQRNPRLTKFCTELTGISQDTVDAADPLPVVVERFGEWLRTVLYPICRAWREHHDGAGSSRNNRNKLEHAAVVAAAAGTSTTNTSASAAVRPSSSSTAEYSPLLSKNLRGEQKRFTYDDRTDAARTVLSEERMVCFATDGPWDMRKFMHECGVLRDKVDFPPVCYRYINVRHAFCDYFKCRQVKLTHMLRRLHMSFEGQRHSGIADTRNIARVLADLMARGYRVHHVSCIKYAHRGDAFLASNQAAQELLLEYGGGDDDNRANRNRSRNGNTNSNSYSDGGGKKGGNPDARKSLPRNMRQKPKK